MADFNININADVTDDNSVLGETVAIDDLIYLSTDSKWYLADASLPSKSTTELRIALEAGILDDTISTLVYGYHTYTTAVFSAGTKYYVSTTAGEVTSSTPVPDVVRYTGTAYSTTVMLFNPDQTYLSDNNRKVNGEDINISHTHLEADITDLDKYTVAEVDALIGTATDNNYVHTESPASASWVINHAMGKQYPSVDVVDNSGNSVEGDITYTDANNLTITFNTSFAGFAYLN
jgi:hypothetical protein